MRVLRDRIGDVSIYIDVLDEEIEGTLSLFETPS